MKLKVATYNVRNMFDRKDDPHKADPRKAKPASELEALAAGILRSGPDVLALQEVENREVLDQFADQRLDGAYPYRALVEGNDIRGIDVAVLSKFPIEGVVSHREDRFPLSRGARETSFRRDLLRVDLDLGEKSLSLYALHLKSKIGGKRADVQRLAEARQVERIVQREMGPDRPFLVLGDCNDTPDSPTLAALTEGLQDAMSGRAPAQRATYSTTRPKEEFDYILYSGPLKVHGARVERAPESARASDHFLLSAQVEV